MIRTKEIKMTVFFNIPKYNAILQSFDERTFLRKGVIGMERGGGIRQSGWWTRLDRQTDGYKYKIGTATYRKASTYNENYISKYMLYEESSGAR